MRRTLHLLVLLLLLSQGYSYAQAIKVSGRITSATNEALIGVSVVVSGTTQGTTSDVDGNYALRPFASFRQAAAEASVSRFYGGIHYMDSVTGGNEQGRQIGRYIVGKVLVPSAKAQPGKSQATLRK